MNFAATLTNTLRRVKKGRPIVVVSGLPRSGTSMMMQMLAAGGLEVATDDLRQADDSNPQGYFELERVKDLDKEGDLSWLRDARGKGIKIIAFLLRYLPQQYDYKVIFMHRDLGEILASQAKMLTRRGEPAGTDDERMREIFEEHLRDTERLLKYRPCFTVYDVSYSQIVSNPLEEARRVNGFLGNQLDPERMAATVNPELYRNRRRSPA